MLLFSSFFPFLIVPPTFASPLQKLARSTIRGSGVHNINPVEDGPTMTGTPSANLWKYRYLLHGVAIHSGGARGGHYYNFVRCWDVWWDWLKAREKWEKEGNVGAFPLPRPGKGWYIMSDENTARCDWVDVQGHGFGSSGWEKGVWSCL
jgi:hypothetical protein